MRSTIETNYYVGIRTFSDRTASLAVGRAREGQRKLLYHERQRKKLQRQAAAFVNRSDSNDPNALRATQLSREIGTFRQQRATGVINQEEFNHLASPLLHELRVLVKPQT